MATLTDREYDAELHRLHDQLLIMGARVEEMIANSMRALVERDTDVAQRTIEFDHQINRLEVEIDELCLRILARRQPVASDLRLITLALKLVTDLERIGDIGVNICERVIELNMEPPLKQYVDLPRMAQIVQGMIRDALDAFVNADVDRSRDVVERDRVVDAYYGQIFRELLTYMMEDTRNIYRAIRLQSIAKYLERIGDHATNLAEMVIFMVLGKDVRHLGSMTEPSARRMPRGILFLCRQNAARSQMAEALARKRLPSGIHIASAGSEPAAAVNPWAVRTMQEVGLDISSQQPKPLAEVAWGDFDTVVTLCAEEVCVVPPRGLRQYHWPLDDPAAVAGTDAEIQAAFRATRDEIERWLRELVEGFR
ncbi:MAG: phosphate signaling complex protein PhoU [Betaproteobacteria bacterium]|nr:phosphate signaling complex protein PhoU [Betaproteobacteria bacterium]